MTFGSHLTRQIYRADITLHLHTTRCRRKLSDAAHVPQTDRAETPLSLFIYFCSFLVMKIYDRTFSTSRGLFTQANTNVETMILVLKGLRFSHYYGGCTGLCQWSGRGFSCYSFLIGQSSVCVKGRRVTQASCVITGSASGYYQQ